MTTSTVDAVVADLHGWIVEQPLWRQQAFRYLLSQPCLENAQRAEVRDLLLAEAGYVGSKRRGAPQPIKAHEIAAPPEGRQLNRLHRLFGLTQVNALAEDNELRFDPEGLTIVYGPNGAGKSSYVRSLKRLCRSVDRDESILPNVLKQGAKQGTPHARIEWAPANTTVTGQQFDLSDPSLRTPIDSISVFDSRCAQIYVDEENQLAFVPSVVRVLVRLAEEQMAIQQEVDDLIAAAKTKRPDLGSIAVGTKARAAVEAVTANSQRSDFDPLTTLSGDEQSRRKQLELALAAAATGETDRQQAQLRAQGRLARELVEHVNSVAAMLGSDRVVELRSVINEVARTRDVARLAADEAFASEDLPGVGSDPWKTLWESARKFYIEACSERAAESTPAFPDTSTGAECPLCLQELDQAARDRFERFETFVKGDAEAGIVKAERALKTEVAQLREQTLAACRTPFLDSLSDTNPKLQRSINDWLSDASDFREALTTSSTGGVFPDGSLAAPPLEGLEEFATARDREADAVTVAVKPEEKKLFETELGELKAREAFAALLDEVMRWVGELRQISALEKAKSALRTQGISIKQKALTEQIVTAALKDQLRAELDALGFTHIAFELRPRGEHGVTMLQLRLRDAPEQKLASILSDGEKRALALAFFLAEVATAESLGGIVLDDPVSSLDQERRHVVGRRIAVESGRRQVIVFTHDIAFLFHLRAEAEAAGFEPKMQQVWRDGDLVGRTAAEAPFDACRVKERIGWLENALQEMPKEGEFKSDDERRMHVSSWYRQLRGSWERAVEEIVFNETIERFTPNVQTQRLKKVVITQEMLDELEDGMSNCSSWMHDRPAAAGGALPSRLEMRQDLDAFKDFCKMHRPK